MEEIFVKLLHRNSGKEVDAVIKCDSAQGGYIQISSDDGNVWHASSGNLFDSLVSIRREMEKEAIFPLCNGARINLAVSSGGRQASATRRVYKVEIGQQAQRHNLVDIFEYAECDSVGTVEEQKEFNRKWVSSLREKSHKA